MKKKDTIPSFFFSHLLIFTSLGLNLVFSLLIIYLIFQYKHYFQFAFFDLLPPYHLFLSLIVSRTTIYAHVGDVKHSCSSILPKCLCWKFFLNQHSNSLALENFIPNHFARLINVGDLNAVKPVLWRWFWCCKRI